MPHSIEPPACCLPSFSWVNNANFITSQNFKEPCRNLNNRIITTSNLFKSHRVLDTYNEKDNLRNSCYHNNYNDTITSFKI